MAPGDFNGKDYGGGHTGMGWYHYNWSSVANYKDSYPSNKDLVEGQKVSYIGKDKRYKNATGVVLKPNRKYGRSWFPVRFEVFDSQSSSLKFKTLYCVKTQLQLPIILKDKRDERNNLLIKKKYIRKRKKHHIRQNRKHKKSSRE